jgi:hypothetical protein
MSTNPVGSRLAGLRRWRQQLTVPQFTVVTGALVILGGTFVLASPLCSSDDVGLWQALFTVASAITVTGLSIIVVERDLTLLGQVVLAGLIITGGLADGNHHLPAGVRAGAQRPAPAARQGPRPR